MIPPYDVLLVYTFWNTCMFHKRGSSEYESSCDGVSWPLLEVQLHPDRLALVREVEDVRQLLPELRHHCRCRQRCPESLPQEDQAQARQGRTPRCLHEHHQDLRCSRLKAHRARHRRTRIQPLTYEMLSLVSLKARRSRQQMSMKKEHLMLLEFVRPWMEDRVHNLSLQV